MHEFRDLPVDFLCLSVLVGERVENFIEQPHLLRVILVELTHGAQELGLVEAVPVDAVRFTLPEFRLHLRICRCVQTIESRLILMEYSASMRHTHRLRQHRGVDHRVRVEVTIPHGHASLHLLPLEAESDVGAVLKQGATGGEFLPLDFVSLGLLEANRCLVELYVRRLGHTLVCEASDLDVEIVWVLQLPFLNRVRCLSSFAPREPALVPLYVFLLNLVLRLYLRFERLGIAHVDIFVRLDQVNFHVDFASVADHLALITSSHGFTDC